MSESLAWFHKTSSLHEFLLRIWLEFPTVSMDHYQFLSSSTNAFSFGCEWEISSTCACVWRLGSQLVRLPKRDYWLRVFFSLLSSRTVLRLLFTVTGRSDFWEFGSHDVRTWALDKKPCKASPMVSGFTFLPPFPCFLMSHKPHSCILFKHLLLRSLAQESWSSEQSIWNIKCNDHEIVIHDHLIQLLRVA